MIFVEYIDRSAIQNIARDPVAWKPLAPLLYFHESSFDWNVTKYKALFFIFYRMNNAPPPNIIFIRIFPENLIRSLSNTTYRFLCKVFQAVILYWLWTYVEQYNRFTVCFQALLFIDDLYQKTLDRKNCILLLVLMMTSVFMVFHAKSFYGSVLLMTISSIYLKPIDSFQKATVMKALIDFSWVGFRWSDARKKMSSKFTDFTCTLLMAYFHMDLGLTDSDCRSVEDLCLIPIFMMHFFVLYSRLYNMTTLAIATGLTVMWMVLKSSKYARKRSALTVASLIN